MLIRPYYQFQAFIIASTATEEEMLKWYANFNSYSLSLSLSLSISHAFLILNYYVIDIP
jgi:hypothetical protein